MKPRLNRGTIAIAALELADDVGLEQVTMRRLAKRLGVAPMSLYRHVANKEELFDAMLDDVVRRLLPFEALGAAWPEEVRAIAREGRRLLGAHPAWLPLLTRVIAPAPAMAVVERLARALHRERPISPRRLHAISALMCFTLGFVLVERMMRGPGESPIPVLQLRALASAAAPQTRVASLAGTFERWSFDDAFEAGLASLVHEIGGRRAA